LTRYAGEHRLMGPLFHSMERDSQVRPLTPAARREGSVMHESETQELADVTSAEREGGSFLAGNVLDTFWDQGGGTATIEAAAKKKKPAKKPKPKPTTGPGCATKSDPTCRGC
jgi:hypothetical protein